MNSCGQNFPDLGQAFRMGRGWVCGQKRIQLLEHEPGACDFPGSMPRREAVRDGFVKGSIAFHARCHEKRQALERSAEDSDCPLERFDPSFDVVRQWNLSLGCVEAAKVEAPAVVSMMRDGGLRLSVNAFPEAP